MVAFSEGWLQRQMAEVRADVDAVGGSTEFVDVVRHCKKQNRRITELEALAREMLGHMERVEGYVREDEWYRCIEKAKQKLGE
jgi:hypothetical protein